MKITINNSLCQVSDFTQEQYKALRSLLSYSEATVSRYAGYTSVRKYLIDRRGVFCTGLLPRVLEAHPELELIDRRIAPTRLPAGSLALKLPYAPRAWQSAAINALEGLNRGLVIAPTGAGKAQWLSMVIQHYQLRTLLVVPTLELKTQITESLKSCFGRDKVGPLSKDGSTPFLISVENVDSMNPKVKPKGVNLLILDEYHSSSTKTYRDLNTKAWTDIYARIGCTATPYRNLSEETLLFESILSEVIYELVYLDAVRDKCIVPANFFYYELPPIKLKGNPKSYATMVSECIIERKDRNELIVETICTLEDAGESTLVLLNEIRHGEIIQDMLKKKGRTVAFANGENPDNRGLLLEFNLKQRKTLIATGVLGVGVDTKPATFVLLVGGGKSKPKFIQAVGRVLRTSPGKEAGNVVLFFDKSHKWFIAHFKEVMKHIKAEYSTVPVKL